MNEPMTADVVGTVSFEATVDEKSNLMDAFGSSEDFIFQTHQRDTGMYSAFMPKIDICVRNDLKILRIEIMHYAFFFVDRLLMRSAKYREKIGEALCSEILSWYVWEFRKRIEPTGKSQEFLQVTAPRLKAYNEAWDTMMADGEKRNRLLVEETIFQFCNPYSKITNIAIYWALQLELMSMQSAFFNFFDSLQLLTDGHV